MPKPKPSKIAALADDAYHYVYRYRLEFEGVMEDLVRALGDDNVHVRNLKLRLQTLNSRCDAVPLLETDKALANKTPKEQKKYIYETSSAAHKSAVTFSNCLLRLMFGCLHALNDELKELKNRLMEEGKWNDPKLRHRYQRLEIEVTMLESELKNQHGKPKLRKFWLGIFDANMEMKEMNYELTKEERASMLEKFLGRFLHRPWKYPEPEDLQKAREEKGKMDSHMSASDWERLMSESMPEEEKEGKKKKKK